jgi:asparaginyl-tRNA synthetase
MKELLFVDINDGSSISNLQLVCNKSDKEKLAFGASVHASGILSETPKGQLEVQVAQLKILGDCPIESYPFVARQSYPNEYIRQHLHLRSRVNKFSSIFRCRHNLTSIINNYLNNQQFIQINTPILTSNDCEGAGEVFFVKPDNNGLLKTMKRNDTQSPEEIFFDSKVFLTVSGQLHLEAMAHGLSKVYTFGPTFRAENSKSPVHLSEFYMLELEESFIVGIEDVASTITDLMKSVTRDFLDKSGDEIVNINRSEKSFKLEENFKWLDKEFPLISYKEAIEVLVKNKSKLKKSVKPEDGLSKEQEIFLAKHFGGPLFVVDWPKEMKSFYMRQKKQEPGIVEALDFIVPNIGELAGGSVREDDYETLKSKLPQPEALKWYLDLRKYGGVTTGGFGMGFERYLQFLLNIHNIKDVIPFPRWAHNCST